MGRTNSDRKSGGRRPAAASSSSRQRAKHDRPSSSASQSKHYTSSYYKRVGSAPPASGSWKRDRGGGGGGSGGAGGGVDDRSVFVGNLLYATSWQDLKDHMRAAGNVSHVEVLMGRDGRSKGCAIVQYESSREAARALRELDGSQLGGRELFVQRDERGDGGRGAATGGGGRPSGGGEDQDDLDCNCFVGNLSYETSWQDLKDHMRQAGNVSHSDILQGPDGRSKGCGVVTYEHPKDAQRARRELNESTLNGRTIYVQRDKGKGGHSGGDMDEDMDDEDVVVKYQNNDDDSTGNGDGCQLYVGNLSYDTSWQDLKDHFRTCGEVLRADVMEGPDGWKKGFGTVKFANRSNAEEAIRRLDGREFQGRRLVVRLDHKA